MESVVRTRYGRIEGARQGRVLVFRGIPFARPPIGALRFEPPEPPEPWTGVRSAKRFGPSAPQVGPVNRLIRAMIQTTGSSQSQDCLYLNVWTPAADAARRPVMVFIHGGAFILGSGATPLYHGHRLADRGDVVVVTINYRLGAHGYLDLRSFAAGAARPAANLGLRDQIAALEWVRDSVAHFGGDPENVTLFGESAGAMSIGTLLGTPSAAGLFHKAILQSGAAHHVSSAERADRVAQEFARRLRLERDVLGALRGVPVAEVMRAQAWVSASLGVREGELAWQPFVDGDLLPRHPLEAIEAGLSADVPVLIGTNRDEWKLFMLGDPRARSLDESDLGRRFRQILATEPACLARVGGAYERVQGSRGGEPSERWAAFQSDRIFHYPAARLADLMARHQPRTYAYLFAFCPPLARRWPGACHGLELPFVFGAMRVPWLRMTLGIGSGALSLCDAMQTAWTTFARTGSPEHASLPEWPAWSEEARNALRLSHACSLQEDPHQRARVFWDPLLADGGGAWAAAAHRGLAVVRGDDDTGASRPANA